MSSSATTRAKYRELGLCTECGKPAREGKTTCADCAAKHSKTYRQRKGIEVIRGRGRPSEYVYTAWRGRSIVKRGTVGELAKFFGTDDKTIALYAVKGIRRRKDGVFFERERV